MQDNFKHKAQEWDKGDIRVQNALLIADEISKTIKFSNDMEIMDFGVGTGLLGFEIAKIVKQVYGVDTSAKMLEKLQEKNQNELQIKAINQDITQTPLKQKFHGIVSSMTLHHIEKLEDFFDIIKNNLLDDGFIAIADLEKEDGTFHSDNTGVFHFGFDENELYNILKKSGYKNIQFRNINTINKPHKDYGVFLLTANK